jgi:hypothetical protein
LIFRALLIFLLTNGLNNFDSSYYILPLTGISEPTFTSK